METFCAPFLNVPFLSEDLLIPLLERPQVCNRFLSPQAKRWSETLALLDSGESDLETALMQLKPWRKGPYRLSNMTLDAEWNCFLKWNRMQSVLTDLSGQVVLDIGCNSGFFMFELVRYQPKWILGIDPASIYWYQFQLIQRYYKKRNVFMLPFGFDVLPDLKISYDLILCMGILYHHVEPLSLLKLMKNHLKTGGKIILETLILDQADDTVLKPSGRYARMKNVFFIPTISVLQSWCAEAGFEKVEVVDVSETSSEEQRVTKWSSGQSLDSFLCLSDSSKTVEGYPRPVRAMLVLSE